MPESKITRPVIGWFCGVQDWAYKNLCEKLAEALPDFEHVFNRCGDINILVAMDQFNFCDADGTIILHLDGNRWLDCEKKNTQLGI